MPTIGGKRVDAITTADVLAILKPIWNVKTDAAPRIKRRIAAVMAWAVAHGHRTDNPVASVDAVLPKQARNHEHRKALPYAEVPQAIATVRNAHRGSTSAKLALEFLILTAARSGEVRGATSPSPRSAAGNAKPRSRLPARVERMATAALDDGVAMATATA